MGEDDAQQPGSRSGAGGAADEAGGQYRRAVAAFFAAHGLNGLPLEGLPLEGDEALVESVALEASFPIDDIVLELKSGQLYVQAKRSLRFGRPMDEVADQWVRAVRAEDFERNAGYIAAVGGELSAPIRDLAQALNRRRRRAKTFSRKELDAIERLDKLLRRKGADPPEVQLILKRAIVFQLQVEEAGQEHAERGRLLLDGHVVRKGAGTRAWRDLISIAGEAARLRLGHSIGAWLGEMRKKGVPLTADADASERHILNRDTKRYVDTESGYECVGLTST